MLLTPPFIKNYDDKRATVFFNVALSTDLPGSIPAIHKMSKKNTTFCIPQSLLLHILWCKSFFNQEFTFSGFFETFFPLPIGKQCKRTKRMMCSRFVQREKSITRPSVSGVSR
ncbi:MAG: hypothetical protein D8M57_10170 [Candidatus Scalindua sp. AMX11]|nr:MAG: hypothetical protein DWQ00_01305 [Candidatus Scalindua sp.]TDE64955.1 MAG: hypothetical protein D8M57_10170 [Candidatus Scalindua sp. AMX11]